LPEIGIRDFNFNCYSPFMNIWRATWLFWLVVFVGPGTLPATGQEWVVVPTSRAGSLAGAAEAPPEAALAGFDGGSDFFPESRGTYNGLISPADEVVPERAGYFRIYISSWGRYSGQFVVGDDTFPIRGWFNSQGLAGVSIYRRVWDDCHCFKELVLVWTVELDLVPDSDEIEGTLVNERRGGWEVDLYGLRAGYYSSGGAPQEGRYTLRLPGSVDPAVAPPGDGYAAVTVTTRGLARLSGALPDGVKIADNAYLSVDGYWPVYIPLSSGHGVVFGWLQFDGSDLAGELTWLKPRNLDRVFYPEGFSGAINARGGRYELPVGSVGPFTWTEGQIQFSDGNLPDVLIHDVDFTSSRSVAIGGGDVTGLKMRVNTRTGLFNGTFIHPGNGRRTAYAGGLFQFEDAGGGFFLGTDQGGTVAFVGAGASE
jgi:hypothetical protein